jgi:DNA-binding response OmpR family regulator
VISDVRLPDGDGLDVVRAARSGVDPPTTIVVSGFVSSHVRKAALDAGANAFFVKPFQAAALTAEIRALIADRPQA